MICYDAATAKAALHVLGVAKLHVPDNVCGGLHMWAQFINTHTAVVFCCSKPLLPNQFEVIQN